MGVQVFAINSPLSAGAWQPLTLAQGPRIAPLLAQRIAGLGPLAIADLSFANLWLFRRVHAYQWLDGAWPVIRGRSYDGQAHVLPLFDVRAAPPALWPSLLGGGECLFPLTEDEAQALDPVLFSLHSLRDDADYLYPAQAFHDYAGAGLHNKRNLLKQCVAQYRLRWEPYAPCWQAMANAVLAQWLKDKGKQPGDADDLPCQEALAQAQALGLHGWVCWADGHPAGFLLAEELQPGVAVIRFAKTLSRFKGLAQALFQHHALHTTLPSGQPLQWLNFEQDLGLPNFRQTKLSYQPQRLLPKYRASLRVACEATLSGR